MCHRFVSYGNFPDCRVDGLGAQHVPEAFNCRLVIGAARHEQHFNKHWHYFRPSRSVRTGDCLGARDRLLFEFPIALSQIQGKFALTLSIVSAARCAASPICIAASCPFERFRIKSRIHSGLHSRVKSNRLEPSRLDSIAGRILLLQMKSSAT